MMRLAHLAGTALTVLICACPSPEAPPEPPAPQPEEAAAEEPARQVEMEPLGHPGPKTDVLEILDMRGDVTECPLHEEEMLEDVVLIVGGLPLPGGIDPREAEFYPHANTEFWTGTCDPGPEMLAKVLYCPECRKRKAAVDDQR